MKQERFIQIINDLNDLKKFTKSNISNKNIIDYVNDVVSEIKNDIDIGWIFQNPFTETTRMLVQRIDHFLYTLW